MARIIRRRIIEYEEDIPNTLNGFLKWQFTSGPTTGEDFGVFARLFRKEIEGQLKSRDAELVDFHKGHYDLFGFIRGKGNEYVYFSISDVRHFPNDWYSNILIRTAKDTRDYTGGANHYVSLKNFARNVLGLLYSGK